MRATKLRYAPNKISFVPTGSRQESDYVPLRVINIIPQLILLMIAGFTNCFLFVTIPLAALATQINTVILSRLMYIIVTITLVVGLVQLAWHPEYCIVLLPLGTFRY